MSTTAARRRALRHLIVHNAITSQADLVGRLSASGHVVTQATVSRDLAAIGAAKDHADRYVLGEKISSGEAMATLARLVDEFVESIRVGGNLVVLRTPPGAAQVVAAAVDSAGLVGVIGTVAGDDTIFVATESAKAAKTVVATLEEIGANS